MKAFPVLAGPRTISKRTGARWFCGIDLGTTNSSIAILDSWAFRSNDRPLEVNMVPIGQSTRTGVPCPNDRGTNAVRSLYARPGLGVPEHSARERDKGTEAVGRLGFGRSSYRAGDAAEERLFRQRRRARTRCPVLEESTHESLARLSAVTALPAGVLWLDKRPYLLNTKPRAVSVKEFHRQPLSLLLRG